MRDWNFLWYVGVVRCCCCYYWAAHEFSHGNSLCHRLRLWQFLWIIICILPQKREVSLSKNWRPQQTTTTGAIHQQRWWLIWVLRYRYLLEFCQCAHVVMTYGGNSWNPFMNPYQRRWVVWFALLGLYFTGWSSMEGFSVAVAQHTSEFRNVFCNDSENFDTNRY